MINISINNTYNRDHRVNVDFPFNHKLKAKRRPTLNQ